MNWRWLARLSYLLSVFFLLFRGPEVAFINISDIFIICSLALFVQSSDKIQIPRNTSVLFCLYITVLIPSAFNGPFPVGATFIIELFRYGLCFSMFLLTFNHIRMYKGGFEAIRASLTVAGFVSSVTAISVFVLYNSGVQSGYIESMILSPTNPRVMPFFYDPNHYASVLVVAIAFILSGIFDSTAVKSVSGQIIYSASLVLSIVAVLMTGSRSGIGALVVVIGFTTLIKTMVSDFKYSIQKAVAVGFPTLVIALIGLAVTGLMDSLVANVRVRTISAALELRISLWHAAIATWEHYPITGVGPHNFIRYLETLPDELVPRRILFPHNTYLTLLSETGLLGAIVGIGIVIEQLVGGIREIISDATSELIVTVSALLALLAMAMFIDIYDSRRLWFVLGVLAALSMQGESRYMSIRNLT